MNPPARWWRGVFATAGLLLLTAGQRSGHSSGCGASSCNVDLSPRTIAFVPGDAEHYTFHFLVGASTAITGQSAIPSDLWAGPTKGFTAKTLLDSNSEGYLFDASSLIQFGGFRAPSIFDPPRTVTPHWAHLPYTYDDNGPLQTVPLQPNSGLATTLPPTWLFPIRTVRVADHGLCYASASSTTLASGLLQSLIGSLTSCSTSTGKAFVETTGVFTSAPAAVSLPITATPVQDHLLWDIQIDGVIYTGAGSNCSIRTTAGADTRLIHGLSIVSGPTKGTRVQVTHFTLVTGANISPTARPPGTVEDSINDQIRSDFPKKFANKINSNFIIPISNGGAFPIWKANKAVADYGTLVTCKTDTECERHGPEDGCFKPDPNGEVLSPSLVQDSVNGDLNKAGLGVCVWRLQPKRINIVPTGIEIVLIENQSDALYSTVQLLSNLQPGGALACSAPLPLPLDPLSPDAGGELLAGRALSSFANGGTP